MKVLNVSLNGKRPGRLIASLMIPILLLGLLAGCASANSKVLNHNLSIPLEGATSARVEISTDSGNLTMDKLATGEALANGTLQYLESQGIPTQSVSTSGGQAALTLKTNHAAKQGFRFPWDACGAAIEWQIHLNPSLPADITAHSGGGNVKLDFTGMAVTRLSADTGGGNVDVVLPEQAASLNVTAKTGAGNVALEVGRLSGASAITASSGAGDVTVRLPGGTAARIHITSGAGKATLDPSFQKIDDQTYQSPNYDSAASKVEITLHSGAGNVNVNTR